MIDQQRQRQRGSGGAVLLGALLIALGAGFIAGQLLFRRRTLADELAE